MKKYWWLIIFILFMAYLGLSDYHKQTSHQEQKYNSYTFEHSLTKKYTKEDYARSNQFIKLYNEDIPDKRAIKKLINSGLEVNAPTYYNDENYGDLPLSTACFAADYEIAELLIKKGAVQSVWGARIPIYAATNSYEKGDLKLVKLLLSNGADKVVSGDEISEKVEATSPYSREGRIYTEEEEHEITLIFKELIKAGALVDQQAVVVAAKYNDMELLDYFIEEVGMDVNEGYKSPMMVTSSSPFETTYSPLIAASDNNSLEAAKYLIEHGADKNIKNNVGKKALDYAKTDEMRALLSQ
jgi:hypothetical protein